jgi:predicted lipid-binding transport protein (Tim44 family)
MTYCKFGAATLIWALAAGPLYAQQAADASKTTAPASAATPPAAPAPADHAATAAAPTSATPPAAQTPVSADKDPTIPSPEFLRKARAAGYQTEVRKGVTRFCREETPTGTRFTSKKCLDQAGMEAELNMEAAQHDALVKGIGGCSGCNGK